MKLRTQEQSDVLHSLDWALICFHMLRSSAGNMWMSMAYCMFTILSEVCVWIFVV